MSKHDIAQIGIPVLACLLMTYMHQAEAQSFREEYETRERMRTSNTEYCNEAEKDFTAWFDSETVLREEQGKIYQFLKSSSGEECSERIIGEIGRTYQEEGDFGNVYKYQYLIEGDKICKYSKTFNTHDGTSSGVSKACTYGSIYLFK